MSLVPLNRAMTALDKLLPSHTYRNRIHAGQRLWTSAVGSFEMCIEGEHPRIQIVFTQAEEGWEVRVPVTVAGLDVLTMAMVAAGAIEPYGITYSSLMDAVRGVRSRGGGAEWPHAGWASR